MSPRRRIALRLMVACSALLVVTPAAYGPDRPTGPAPEGLYRKAQQLHTEEQRQIVANQRLRLVTERYARIMADLQSNGLLKRMGGDDLAGRKQTVREVGDKHVTSAAKSLRMAREDLPSIRVHLRAADKQVEIAIQKLKKLIGDLASDLALEGLLVELRAIIRKQARLRAATILWGRPLLQNPRAAAGRRAADLAQIQAELGRRIERFIGRLGAAATQEQDERLKERMQNALGVLRRKGALKLSDAAAVAIKGAKPVGAVNAQNRLLKVLREAERILAADDTSTRNVGDLDALAKLEEILAKLQELLGQLQSIDVEGLEAVAGDFQAELAQMMADLQALLAQLEGIDLSQLQAALQALDGAGIGIGQGQLGVGMGGISLAISLLPGIKLGPPGPWSANSTEGPRLFALSDEVAGPQAKAGASRIKVLSGRQRRAIYEKYARELPAEYRRLLEDYYDALSK